jgi:outer membrane protein OmpA-like peptidoglycan-associated protein
MRTIAALSLVATFVGCATAMPPQDLVTARSSYDRASHGPTAQLDPADLHAAKETLDSAEKSFADDGDTQVTRDLAYTAERRTEIAESRGRTVQSEQDRSGVVSQMNANQTSAIRDTSAALGRATQQLASQGQQLQNAGQQLQTERQRREDADRRAAQSAADLARIASVKQEPRGMVITLSGSVLFASAKSDLLPDAQVKLIDVAKALSEQDPESKIVVEGYTDSQGAAAFNQDLSQRRAESVRAYLVSHGIAADRVTSQGFGPSKAIADNTTAEGRANNRRVEIVVQPNPQHAQR